MLVRRAGLWGKCGGGCLECEMVRVAVVAVAWALAFGSVPHAAENFIPQGHSYAPDSGGLPPLNSPEDNVDNRTDVLQTEIYVRERQRKQFDSDLNRFIYSQELVPSDNTIDY